MAKRTREFIFPGTWEDFIAQADRYGKAKMGADFVTYVTSGPGIDTRPILVHRIVGPGAELSVIDFTGAYDAHEQLTITATFDPDEPAAIQYLDGLIKRLRQPGARAGTLDRVKEVHRLVKQEGYSLRAALKKVGTHYDTYQKYCTEATGEEPYTRR